MKWGRNSAHQTRYVVAIFPILLAAAALSAQTAQSSLTTPEEKRARNAVAKYVGDGPAKDYLNAALDLTHEVNSKLPVNSAAANTGIATALEDMAKIKAKGQTIPENYARALVIGVGEFAQTVLIQKDTTLKSYFSDTPSAERAYQNLVTSNANKLIYNINRDIKAADTTALERESRVSGVGTTYDPTKSVGLGGPGYRDILKSAAPTVDHLLANANVDQSQAEGAVALERGSIINKALESSRKLPDLVISSFAFEARTLSPSEFEKARMELARFITSNIAADSDEVNGAMETLAQSSQKGVDPNNPAFERANAALKSYVSDALRTAELGGGGSSGAVRKAGVQNNRQ